MLTQQSAAASLLARFVQVREATMRFCSPLTPEDMMVQSCSEASPVKWHLAHTSWFFETFVLTEFVPEYKPFHPDFRWLFNSYYNGVGDLPEKKYLGLNTNSSILSSRSPTSNTRSSRIRCSRLISRQRRTTHATMRWLRPWSGFRLRRTSLGWWRSA